VHLGFVVCKLLLWVRLYGTDADDVVVCLGPSACDADARVLQLVHVMNGVFLLHVWHAVVRMCRFWVRWGRGLCAFWVGCFPVFCVGCASSPVCGVVCTCSYLSLSADG
jgi:hypothetical protein